MKSTDEAAIDRVAATGIAIIEAILFASGEPISADKLSAVCGTDNETIIKLIGQLERRYNVSESGLRIIRLSSSYQITTRTEYSDYVKAALESKKQTPLSPAAMEALAIIAYNQPVTKAFVEQVRGVDSSGVVNTLVERGLAEEAGRLDLPGRPVSYRTADNFLRCFGLASLDELPIIQNSKEQLKFEALENITTTVAKNKAGKDSGNVDVSESNDSGIGTTENDTEIYDFL